MTEESYKRNMVVAENLKLPSKFEEVEIFTNYDMIAVFDRYLPLVDYILDEYASASDEINMNVEETVYLALMSTIANFRKKSLYEKSVPFSQFVSAMTYSFMEEYEQEGKLYKISRSFVTK